VTGVPEGAGAREVVPGAEPPSAATRRMAVATVVVALGLAVASWRWLGTASDAGIARLARIDVQRARCDSLWARSLSSADTLLADRVALADTIDPRASQPLARCGDLRGVVRGAPAPGTLPNPREMSGEPMPRGLR
jgi:hypothetical protein